METLKKRRWLIVAAAILLVAAICVVGAVAGNLFGEKAPDDTELDTDVKTVEQLRELLLQEEELEITVNVDLEVSETLEVTGVKYITGTGKLVVPLGIREKVSIFNVSEGASLSLRGLEMDGNATGDAVTVQKKGQVQIEDVTIVWPYQYGVAVYGQATLKNVSVDNAPTAAVLASGGSDVKVDGGTFTNSPSLIMYVEGGGKLELTGEPVLQGSEKHGITNRGTLTIGGGSITGCEQYAIVNYGELNVAYSGNKEDGRIVLAQNSKGAIYNYADGVVDAEDLKIYDSTMSSISNSGTMVIRDSSVENSGTNGIYNTAKFTGIGLTISGSKNCGIYNQNPGVLELSSSAVLDSTKRGVHNKGGNVTLTAVEVSGCGTHGVANTIDDYGNAGVLHASGLSVSGCTTNIYNEKAGVQTTISDSILYKAERTNVVVSYGSMELNSVRILGSSAEKTYALQVAKGASCVVSGSGEITGAASRGVTNHGTLYITGGRIHGNNGHASGGGVFTDGVLYISGGEICGNTAASAGGGVSVGYSTTDSDLVGELYMTGGKIYDNVAATNGGGIYISKGIAYEGVNNGEILYCYAELTGGEVYGNTAMAGNGMMTSAGCVVGGSFYLHKDSVLRLNSGVVLTMKPFTSHTSVDPMRVSATGAEGTVIMTNASAEAAEKMLSCIKSDSITVDFTRQGSSIVLKAGEYVAVGEMDMTGAEVVEVTTFQQLKNAVESTSSGAKKTVKVAANIGMLETITVPVGATVQVVDDGQTRTLLRSISMTEGAFFNVPSGAAFGVRSTGEKTLVLDGNNANVAVTAANSALLLSGGETHVLGAVLRNNYATAEKLTGCYGGLIYVSDGIVNIKEASLSGGNANNGGAIYINGGQVTLTNTDVSNCISKASGGAIRYQGGSLTVNGGSFTNNAGTTGGAIAVDKGVVLTLDGTVFTGNKTTGGHGGAVYATAESQVKAANVTFAGNATGGNGSYYGGAVGLNSNSMGSFENCIFTENVSDHEGTSNGGALYVAAASKASITGSSKFVGNKTSGNGGVIYGNKDSIVTVGSGVEFSKNQAKQGAVAYVTGYTLQVTGAVVNENQVTASGGVFYVTSGGVLDVSNSSFSGNVASTYGGVMNVTKDTTVTINACTFTGNTAKAENNANTLMLSTQAVVDVNDVTITAADEAVADVRLHNTSKLNISGKTILGTVYYGDQASLIHVSAALEEGAGVTILPNAYTEGLQVIGAADADLLSASIAHCSVVPNGTEQWTVNTSGCLVNNSAEAMLGETPYQSVAEALTNAKTGDEVKLLRDAAVEQPVTVPADVILNGEGFRVTGDVVAETAAQLKNVTVSGDLTVQGDLDLTTVIVSGSITVADNGKVTLGAGSNAGSIALGTNAAIVLNEALGEVSIRLNSVVETVGTSLLTGDETVISTEYVKFDLTLSDDALCLGSDGKIQERPFEATIEGKDGSYDTLEDAVGAAVDGDKILVSHTYTVATAITIDKKVTIQATESGATIKRGAANTGAVFTVAQAGDLTLSGLTVDGQEVSAEAALVDNYGVFTLSADATLTKGINTVNAGGLDNRAGATAVVSGTISSCTGKNGGAIRNFPADTETTLPMAILTVSDSALLEGNTSTGTGGAIHQSGELTLGAATLKNNYASSHGGAINFSQNVDNVTVKGTIFEGNTSGGTYGGAVYISGSVTVEMENVTFTGKGAGTALVTNGGAIGVGKNASLTIKGTSTKFEALAATSGGAIYGLEGSSIVIENGEFTNNSTTTGGGGVLVSKGSIEIKGGTFSGNTAASVGGVCNTSGAATITISGGSFTGNTATTNGGAVHVSGSGTLKLTGGTVKNNVDQNDTKVDIWLNNASTSKLDLTGAEASALEIGVVGGKIGSNILNKPDGISFTEYHPIS